jgi:hypothetical protein
MKTEPNYPRKDRDTADLVAMLIASIILLAAIIIASNT